MNISNISCPLFSIMTLAGCPVSSCERTVALWESLHHGKENRLTMTALAYIQELVLAGQP